MTQKALIIKITFTETRPFQFRFSGISHPNGWKPVTTSAKVRLKN